MVLGQIFSPEAISVNLQSESKDEVFEELVEKLVEVYSGLDRTKVLNALLEREQKMSTGIFPGIAVPHARTDMVDKVCGVIGVSKKGIDYDSLDKKPVHLFTNLSMRLNTMTKKRLARSFVESFSLFVGTIPSYSFRLSTLYCIRGG